MIQYLYLGKDGDNGDDDAEDEVEADEDLVLGAVIGLCVVHIEKYHSSNSQGVEEEGESQQACKLHKYSLTGISSNQSNNKNDLLTWKAEKIYLLIIYDN